ncbi:MAG: hypothetical protein LBP19_10935 [Treponema sp.]|jgi:hypothetical protein|nr:hypothetical protein [Treponema sp.]
MKKFLVTAFLALVISVGSTFADHPGGWGIGVQGGWSGGVGGGLSLKVPSVPIYWTINGGNGWLGVSGDYYFIDKTLVPDINLGWYLGAGVFGTFSGLGKTTHITIGGEFVAGLSWQPLKFFEVYLQAAPCIGLQLAPSIGLGANFFNAALGIRFWI